MSSNGNAYRDIDDSPSTHWRTSAADTPLTIDRETCDYGAFVTRRLSNAADVSPASAKNPITSSVPWRNATTGSVTLSPARIAIRPATPSTVPICRAMLSTPLPAPKRAGGIDAVPAPISEGIAVSYTHLTLPTIYS